MLVSGRLQLRGDWVRPPRYEALVGSPEPSEEEEGVLVNLCPTCADGICRHGGKCDDCDCIGDYTEE